MKATRQDSSQTTYKTLVSVDAPAEVEYFVHGGILDLVLRQLPQPQSSGDGYARSGKAHAQQQAGSACDSVYC